MSRHHKSRSDDSRESRHIKKKRRSKCSEVMMGIMWSLLRNLITIVHMIVDQLLENILGYILGPKNVCPPIEDSSSTLIMKSATELAQLIRDRKITSYEVVKAYIDRIQQINGVLNAIVDGPFLEALEIAKEIDERIEKGKISEDEFSEKPFLGVPFTTKDSTAVGGKLQTCGLIARKTTKAKEDAECIRLMKEAGGIIIATTNVPEMNKWVETRNMLIGQTNNPYDTRRSVGGSSGGESSMISACGTAFGIGTDIGGSIRIPAFCCGIFGHKSTTGVVNTKGCTFRTGKDVSSMVTVGPMTRYAKDLLPIFKVLVGPKNAFTLKLDEKVDVKKLKYFYIPQNNVPTCSPISKEMQSVMTQTINHISSITGEQVTLAELPGLEKSSKLWRYWMTQEPETFSNLLGNGVKLNIYLEIIKKFIGKSDYSMSAIFVLIDELLPKEKADQMKEITRKCDEELTKLLGDDGVLIYHSSPRTAPFHYYPLFKIGDFHYFSIFNVLKVPATQVPTGLSSTGLPLGIQIVAARNCDRLCLAVAEELEKAFGGWVPPFTVKNK